jgi:hypothetical protein
MSCFVNGKMYTWKPPLSDRWTDMGFSIWYEDIAELLIHRGASFSANHNLIMCGDFVVCLEQHPEHKHKEHYIKFLTKHGRIGWCIIAPSYMLDWKLVTE